MEFIFIYYFVIQVFQCWVRTRYLIYTFKINTILYITKQNIFSKTNKLDYKNTEKTKSKNHGKNLLK